MRLRKITISLTVLLLTAAAIPILADSTPPPHLGYGFMLSYPPGNLSKVKDAGLDWYKYFLYWDTVEPNKDGSYVWTTLDWRLDESCIAGLNLILRVERDSSDWTPIQDHEMEAWGAFFQALATHILQKRAGCGYAYRVALEVWNEPNLDFQWGYQPVDPERYTRMVKYAYQGAKAGDPNIILVAGGLAPTGGASDGRAMNDVEFLQQMYDAGLKGYFDAISIHNYGYGGAPEDDTYGSGILNFRRAEDIYQVMVNHGDGDKPVWATEFGWLLDSDEEGVECDPNWDASGFSWQQVTSQQQADYLTRAFDYADANWAWMEVMIVSNLDFSTMPWYDTCDPLRWFAVLKPDGSARPAYTALQGMSKRTRSWEVWGMQTATVISLMADVDLLPGVMTRTLTVHNTGEQPFTWSVVTATHNLTFTVSPTSGEPSTPMTVCVDTAGYALGTYTGTITITASSTEVVQSPWIVPVSLWVVPEVYAVHLPLVLRGNTP